MGPIQEPYCESPYRFASKRPLTRCQTQANFLYYYAHAALLETLYGFAKMTSYQFIRCYRVAAEMPSPKYLSILPNMRTPHY